MARFVSKNEKFVLILRFRSQKEKKFYKKSAYQKRVIKQDKNSFLKAIFRD